MAEKGLAMGEARARKQREQEAPPSLEVPRDRFKALTGLLMAVCLTVAGILALVMPLPYADEASYRLWIGVFGTVGGAALLVWDVRTLTVRRNLLRIDERGIEDRSQWMSPGLVRWEEIAAVYVLEMKSGTYLCVEPKDEEALRSRVSRRAARLMQANRETGFAPVRVQFAAFTTRYDASDAMAVVRALHPELVRKKKKLREPKVALGKTGLSLQ